MKKARLIVGLVLVAALVFAAGLGSAAYFSRTFSSNANEVKADEFVITPNGVAEGAGLTKTFAITKFAPEDTGKYEFFVNRTTTLPVKYEVSVSDDRGLPLTYSIAANGVNYGDLNAGNSWTMGNIPMSTASTYDIFVLSYAWPSTADDNSYMGDTCKVSVTLRAIQQSTSTANVEYMQGYVYNYSATGDKAATTSVRVTWNSDKSKILGFEFDSPISGGKITYDNVKGYTGEASFISGMKIEPGYDSGRKVWNFSASGNHGIEIHR